MENKVLLPLYVLARLLQEEAYVVCGKSHLVRVWTARSAWEEDRAVGGVMR